MTKIQKKIFNDAITEMSAMQDKLKEIDESLSSLFVYWRVIMEEEQRVNEKEESNQ